MVKHSRKRSSNDKEPIPREGQNLWQKVTSLRQSFRSKSSKLGVNKEERNHSFHRNRNFQQSYVRSKEGEDISTNPSGGEEPSSHAARKHAYSYPHGEDVTEWDVANSSPDAEMSVAKRGHHRHQRSARKLTKDSGYETSAQDYGSIEWTGQVSSSTENIYLQGEKSQIFGERHDKSVERRASIESLTVSRNVSRYLSSESLANCGHVTYAKSTPSLSSCRESPPPPYTPVAVPGPQEQNEMVTRRFRKGSIHGAQISNSGVDFAPVSHNHCREKQESMHPMQRNNSPDTKHSSSAVPNCSFHEIPWKDNMLPLAAEATKHVPYDRYASKKADSFSSLNAVNKTISAHVTAKQQPSNHEKYPSWPVTTSGIMTNVIPAKSNQRCYSWAAHTDYRKEKTTYSRPQKSFKIVMSQLQPVLERPADISKKKPVDSTGKANLSTSCINVSTAESVLSRSLYTSFCTEDKCSSNISCSQLHQAERSKERMDLALTCLNKYDSFLRNYNQNTSPPSNTSGSSGYGGWRKDSCTPFLDRLRLEHVSTEMGGWAENGKDNLKWHGTGSYSDLSNFSVQMSNRSSLFDSGHSTMPDSGRLSPQSSCSGSILSGGIEAVPRRAQVVSRHGCHRESIVHSSRVQQPERHGSESVVYYDAQQPRKSFAKHSSNKQSKIQDTKFKNFSSNSVENCEKNIQKCKHKENSEVGISKQKQYCNEVNNSFSMDRSTVKSKHLDEKTLLVLDADKQSSNELKSVQKQAVSSFFQQQTEKNVEPSNNQSSEQRNSLPPSRWNEINNSKELKKTLDNSPKVNQYCKVKDSQDYKTMGHHSRSVPNLCELRHENMNIVRTSASQNAKCKLWENQTNGKVASLATMFGGANSSLPKVARSGVSEPSADRMSATSYFGFHKDSNKLQLKVNEISKKDVTTIIETTEQSKLDEESNHIEPPQVPPRRLQKHLSPPIRQPPTRPPPPPPSLHSSVIDKKSTTEIKDSKQTVLLNDCNIHYEKCPSPELPPPPPPCTDAEACFLDEPLPPPPDPRDIEDMSGQPHGHNSLIYPKNSYMCYRSERKLGRHGFDGNYRRASAVPSGSQESCIKVHQNDISSMSSTSWEQLHNIRQHAPTVIFHSDSIHGQSNSEVNKGCNSEFSTSSVSPKDGDSSAKGSLCANSTEKNSGDHPLQTNNVPSRAASTKTESQCDSQSVVSANQLSVNSSQKLVPVRLNENSSKVTVESSARTPQEHFSNSAEDVKNISRSDLCNSNNIDLSHGKTVASDNKIQTGEKDLPIQHSPVSVGVPRISCATQTMDTPSLRRKTKTREELECEQLSRDFIDHCHDRTLKNLLVPLPDQKTMSDYMEGLLDIELETGEHLAQWLLVDNSTTKESSCNENIKEEKCAPLASSSCTAAESNPKLTTKYSKNSPSQERSKDSLMNKKENLIDSIKRKLNKLRSEQTSIREEMSQNEVLGQHVTACVEAVAKPNELEKYMLHVEELEKIINLLLSLSGRLARAQNALINLSEEASDEDKKLLQAKRDKLSEQHEDARRLKESIDRRSQQVSTFLQQYLSKEEYADYDHFIKMKSKLLLEAREIEEKIKLGEEQLTTLCNGMNWQRWKH